MRRRWRRLWGLQPQSGIYPNHLFWTLMERSVLLGDLLFLPEMLTALNRLFKRNTRRLSERELHLAQSVFGKSIDYQTVRVDDCSHIGCRQRHFAYVSFNLINCWGSLSDAHFIHELVHVWQFQRLGSVYIPRALWAQRTAAGYNYGGISALRAAAEQGRGLEQFNMEQQGDVVADYFCLKNNLEPRWCEPDAAYLPYFERVIQKSLLS